MDDAVPQWVMYSVCGHKRWGWGILEHPPYSLDSAPSDFHLFPQNEKNIFVPRDSNHMMMSSMRCKCGCVVRIPPSVYRVLRNGFTA